MNTPGYKWTVIYPNDVQITDEEKAWTDISVLRAYGNEQLYLLAEPALSLQTVVNGRNYILRAPDDETHFFRFYRNRINLLAGDNQILYYAQGYICRDGKVTMEIDSKGNTQVRFESLGE